MNRVTYWYRPHESGRSIEEDIRRNHDGRLVPAGDLRATTSGHEPLQLDGAGFPVVTAAGLKLRDQRYKRVTRRRAELNYGPYDVAVERLIAIEGKERP